MKVLYDHQIFLVQKYGGISKYFCELIKHATIDYELAVLASDNQHLKDDYSFFKKTNIAIPDKEFPGKSFFKKKLYTLNKEYCNYRIKKNQYDILHPTYFDSFFLKYCKKPYVITIHDLIDFKIKEEHLKNDQRLQEITNIIKRADRIIAISKNTKKDLINILSIPENKIDVIYHGYTPSSFKQNINHYGRYVLFVGSRWGYKNFPVFVNAFSRLAAKDSQLHLICVGLPFNDAEKKKLKELGILNKTIVIGASEKKLNSLYSNALAFVYPTLYEGFGMPILEAFANNCPVCLSNTSSLPEVAGNAGVYFDPLDEESILHAIEKVIYDVSFSKRMVELGVLRLNQFSWQKCAELTESAYQKAV